MTGAEEVTGAARVADARRRAEEAFERAIQAERSAIRMQERAADHLRRSADFDLAVGEDPGTHEPERWQELAARAEERADAAQARAELARERLRRDGVDPQAGPGQAGGHGAG